MPKFNKFDLENHSFSVRSYEPFTAMRNLGQLQKTVLPIMQGLMKAFVREENIDLDLADANALSGIGENLASSLDTIIEKIDGPKLENAMRILLDGEYVAVTEKGKENWSKLNEDKVSEIFEGDIYKMFTVAVKVLQFNYANFTFMSNNGKLTQAFAAIKQGFAAKLGNGLTDASSSTEQ